MLHKSLQKIVKKQNYPKAFIIFVKFGTQKSQNYIKQPKFSFMKKIIFIVLLSFISLLGYSQAQLDEQFEGTSLPDASGNWALPSGDWKVFDNGVGDPIRSWTVSVAPGQVYGGTGRSAFVQREGLSNGLTSEDWLVMPRKQMRANEQLRFFSRQLVSADQFTKYEIRVSQNADPFLRSAYETVATYTEAQLQGSGAFNVYNELKVSLGSRALQTLYIAFVKVYAQTTDVAAGDSWLLDNVRLVPECVKPTIPLAPSPINAYNATLRWTHPSGTAIQYEIEYGLFGFQQGTAEGTIVTASGLSSLEKYIGTTGAGPGALLPGTRYQYYVRAICAVGDVSDWSLPQFFVTLNLGAKCADPIVVTPLPYSHQSDTSVYGNWIGNSTAGTNCGTSGGTDFLRSQDAVYAYTADETGLISITMNPFGVASTGVFVYGSCATIGTTCLAGVGNTNGNIRNIPSFNVTEGQTYYIVVSSREVTFNFAYLLQIQKVTCTPPLITSLAANVTGTTTATLSWAAGTSTAWQVAVQTAGENIPSDASPRINVVTNPTVEATAANAGLQSGTNYQYWVRADCGNGTFSQWSGPFLFTTAMCETAQKCNYVFTLRDSGSDGWENGRMIVRQNGVVVATLGAGFSNAGPFDVTVPLCDGIPFELFWSVAGASPAEVRIAVKNRFNQTVYAITTASANLFSTVLYSESPVDCDNAACLPPVTNQATVVGARTATLSWSVPTLPEPAPLSWEIYVVETGAATPTAATLPTYTSTTNSYVINASSVPLYPFQLRPDTTYQFYVRSVCSANSPSAWSTVKSFTTTPTCPRPVGLNAGQIGTNTATLTWTNAGSTATSWEIFVQLAGLPLPTSTTVPTYTSTTMSFQITATTVPGLQPDTDYDFYVRGNCGEADGDSNWSAVRAFRTLPTCPQPTNMTASGIQARQLTYAWNNNNSSATQWQIVALECGTAAPTAATPLDAGVTVSNLTAPLSTILTGLLPETCYEIYIRSICGPNDLSRWSGPTRATTQIAPPECGGLFVDTGGATGEYASNANSTVIICPPAGQVVTVTFTSFATEARYDGLYIYDGNTVNAAQQISSQNGAGTGANLSQPGAFWGTENPGSFTSTTGDGCLTFRFSSDGSGTDEGWVANVTCQPAPTCRPPSAVITSNPQLHTVNVAWTNLNAPETNNFQVIALPCGSPAPTAELATTVGHLVTGTTFTYPDLLSATCYDFYVRAICSSTDLSTWSRASRGVTLVGPLACGGNFVDTGGVMGNYANNANQIVTICPDNPTDIVIVTFASFDTQAQTDGMYVYDGSNINAPAILSPNPAGNAPLTTPGAFWGNTIPGPFESSLAGGCLTFRFRSNGSTNAAGWVSHITCAVAPPCPKPRLLGARNITQTSATLFWTESGTATSWEIIRQVATLPAPLQSANGIPTGLDYAATGLSPGVTYNFYVRAVCSSSEKSRWAGPFSFTTKPINDDCSGAAYAIVNQNLECTQTVRGSLLGATASTPATTCGGGASDDVWFSFIATSQSHIVSFNNVTDDADLEYAVYRGVCGTLTQQSCNAATNLTPGTTYYIRIFSGVSTPQNISFDLCIGTLPCTEAPAFCTGQTVTYANATGIPSLGRIGCLTTTPNPAFFFLQVNQAGPLTYSITQRDAAGGTLDVDYVAWGPFTDLAVACNAVPSNPLAGVTPAPSPSEGCPGSLHACSYDSQADELMCIPNAQLCEVYVLMITNYSDDPGSITFTQTNTGGGTTACFPINTFNYPQTTYCQDGVDPSPILAPGAAAGTYTASPAGLVIDPIGGMIDVSASAPGVYQVTSTTLTSTGGACTNIPSITTTRTVIITLAPNSVTNPTTITYATASNPTAVFCNSVRTPQPVTRTGTTTGSYRLKEGETGLLVDSITGGIIPVTATPGVYHIEYVVAANGGCPAFITETQVTIVTAPIIELPENANTCVSFTLPTLAVGTYYTATGGPTGTGQVITNLTLTESQRVYIYADNGTCSSEEFFEVKINPLPATPTADITQPTCALPSGTAEVTSPVGAAGEYRTNLFISEVTDANTGSLTYVEIFNGTGATVNLSDYKLRFYNNGNASTSTNCDFALVGTLANNAVHVVAVGSATNQGGVVPNQVVAACAGINDNDHIKLTTATNDPIDVFGLSTGVSYTPLNQPGYVYQRMETAVAPSLTWNAADWIVIDPEVYTNVGTYPIPPVVYAYEYSIDNGVTYQNETTFAGLEPGNYSIIVRELATGCISEPFNFVIDPDPSSASVTTFSYTPAVICQDATVTLTPDTSATGFTTGGVFSAVPTDLIIDPATGVINGGSPAGSYTVTYTVPLNAAICQAAGHTDFEVVINNVNATPVTTFTYVPTVCQSSGIILPDTTATGFVTGGNFTYDQTTGLSLNSATGEIDTDTSTPGTYIVTYTVDAIPAICQGAGSTPFTIVILPKVPTVTTFTYTTPICVATGGTLTPDTTATGFTAGGTFTISPATGMTIDATTGVLTVTGATPGNYDITYTVPQIPAICQNDDFTTFRVEIKPTVNAVTGFSYTAAAYCGNVADPAPIPDPGFTTGGFYAATPAGLVINAATGVIDLDASTVGGPYTVTYTVNSDPANCFVGNTSLGVNVTINGATPVEVGFSYSTPVCEGESNPSPIKATGFTEGGTFTATPAGLSINPTTGVVDLSTSTKGINYTVTYEIAADPTICRPLDRNTATISLVQGVIPTITGVCDGSNFVLTVAHSALESQTYEWLNEASAIVGTDATLIITTPGQYTVKVISGGCTSSGAASFTDAEIGCKIQKGISPKGVGPGDGKNDNFDLTGQGISKLEIFNRYGTKVYSRANYVNEWFGQSEKGDELPDGTYYFVKEFKSGANPETGWIYINREK